MADSIQTISNEEMNKIVLHMFQLVSERNEKNILMYIKHYANFRNENGHSIFYFSNSSCIINLYRLLIDKYKLLSIILINSNNS